jgi:hypothetical protein
MKLLTALFFAVMAALTTVKAADTRCFEIRTYYPHEGKMADLQKRFRDHTTKLFTKHGIEQLGYWVPSAKPDEKLVYVLSYPSREARDASWKAFMSDPEWKEAAKASELNGKLVARVTSVFYNATDYSPAIKASKTEPARIFELRTYIAAEGRLDALNARFRDHTVKLFEKHGYGQIGYWVPMAGQPSATNTLVYILAFKDMDAAKASWDAFRKDPVWSSALKASEEKAGGSLTEKGGVKSEYLLPVDFSQTK